MIQAAVKTNLLTIEWVTPEIHDRAWDIYERYSDQTFSFWDCASFAICRELRVDFVFGFGRDFQVAGFELRP
jgi:predicted nucleic acid-binding protein